MDIIVLPKLYLWHIDTSFERTTQFIWDNLPPKYEGWVQLELEVKYDVFDLIQSLSCKEATVTSVLAHIIISIRSSLDFSELLHKLCKDLTQPEVVLNGMSCSAAIDSHVTAKATYRMSVSPTEVSFIEELVSAKESELFKEAFSIRAAIYPSTYIEGSINLNTSSEV